jgi:hypothetical protein
MMSGIQTLVISDSEAEFLYAAAAEHVKRFTLRGAISSAAATSDSAKFMHFRLALLRKGILDGARSFPPQIGRRTVWEPSSSLSGTPTSFDVWGVCQMVLRVDPSLARGKMARAILDRMGGAYDDWRIEAGN